MSGNGQRRGPSTRRRMRSGSLRMTEVNRVLDHYILIAAGSYTDHPITRDHQITRSCHKASSA
jgi:hypothetical protein